MGFRQFQGRSSSSLWIAWSLMRASTSASLRIDVVELGGHDQGRHDRGTLGTAI
jgi:hypothetical protein